MIAKNRPLALTGYQADQGAIPELPESRCARHCNECSQRDDFGPSREAVAGERPRAGLYRSVH